MSDRGNTVTIGRAGETSESPVSTLGVRSRDLMINESCAAFIAWINHNSAHTNTPTDNELAEMASVLTVFAHRDRNVGLFWICMMLHCSAADSLR